MSVVTANGRLAPLDSVTTSYDVGGIHVIQRPNYANDAIAVNLYLLGGTRQLTVATQGIESLLMRVGEYGTEKYPAGAWRTAWGLTGSHIVIDPEADWTLYGFRGIRQDFDSSWNAYSDRLTHSVLAPRSIALVRNRLIAADRAVRDDPDGYVMQLADSVAFVGHPYGLQPGGTEASLTALDSAALARYAAGQMVKSRMLLVVVGNVPRERVESALNRTLTALPQGRYTWSLPAAPAPFHSSVHLTSRAIPTNYIVGIFRGPDASSPSSPAFRVAMALLSGGMNSAIRDKRGLSYAASAPYVERGATAGAVYVSTIAPRTVLAIIAAQMDTVRHLPAMSDLHYFTDQFIIQYFSDNMTSAAQADFVARAQLYQGDYHRASQAMEELRNVSAPEVRAAARRYFRDVHFVYLGDTTQVRRTDFTGF